MSAAPQPNAEAMMVDSIRADAEAQIRQIIETANTAAQNELHLTEEAARVVREEILAKARDKAKKLREREISLANVEARRIVLMAREGSVQKVCERIRSELHAIRADAVAYRRSLAVLMKESLAAIDSPQIQLTLAEQDQKLAGALLLESSRDEKVSSTLNGRVKLKFNGAHDDGGCIAESDDGRVVFNNTYARRFEQAMRTLRANIIEEIVKRHE